MCTIDAAHMRTGAAPSGCASCDGSANLTATGAATPTGSGCADHLTPRLEDDDWGFATSSTHAGSTVHHALFVHDGTRWRLISADETGANWSGTSSTFTFNPPLIEGGYYAYDTP